MQNKTISHKSKDDEISSYFREILNEYDEERVYLSNIKVIQWYNLLQESDLIKLPEKKENKENQKTKDENIASFHIKE